VRRGEIRWYTFAAPDKRRPVLLLTRTGVIDTLNEIIVAPATRTIRGLATEELPSNADGMPETCALNFDHVTLAQRSRLGPVITDACRSSCLRSVSAEPIPTAARSADQRAR